MKEIKNYPENGLIAQKEENQKPWLLFFLFSMTLLLNV